MGRRFISGLIFLGCAFLGFAQADDFRVMTFNIRYDNPQDGKYSWKNRKGMVEKIFRLYEPEIIGVQEALKNQVSEIQGMLPGYSVFGAGRDDGRTEGESTAICFDTTRFSFLEGTTFWLSETPEIPGSKSWNTACTRIATWVRLHDKRAGFELFVFNTHFDHVSEEARNQSARLILEKMLEITRGCPVILTGDFNATDTSMTYRIITGTDNGIRLQDTRSLAGEKATGPSFSYAGFPYHPRKNELIDFIFLSGKNILHVNDNQVIDYHTGDKYPSDHLPVMTSFTVKNKQ